MALGECHLPWVQHSGKTGQHHFKKFFPKPSPSASISHSGKLASPPSDPLWHSGKAPECYVEALREPISFFFSFFAPSFCDAFLHYSKLFAQIWSNFKFFSYISWVFCFVEFFHTSNLNYRCMKSCNLAIQKMIFMTFGVYWGCIQEPTWNFKHLVTMTWRTTYRRSVSKLQKIRTKSENHETCWGIVLSHVEVVCNNWEDFEQVGMPDA
jgi:hypothetical protein